MGKKIRCVMSGAKSVLHAQGWHIVLQFPLRYRCGGGKWCFCFGGEQEGLKSPNPCVDKHCPHLLYVKWLDWTVKTMARDPKSNMMAVREINPKYWKMACCQQNEAVLRVILTITVY